MSTYLSNPAFFVRSSQAGDAHWNEEAKALIAGLLLCIIAEEPQERRTLSTLRDCLTITPAAFMAS